VIRIHKTALVPYSIDNMFTLVSDIRRYPEFLPWCKYVAISSQNDSQVIASITMSRAGLEKSFTTTNVVKTNESIDMRLLEGPFNHLEGRWNFEALGEEGCKISLKMAFEIRNPVLRLSLEPVFTKIVNTLVDAFVKRANELYA
jgi:ribosome-associated toxin RatA of RatAB toxin-antitoxin module